MKNLIKVYFRDFCTGQWSLDSQYMSSAPDVIKALQELSNRLARSEGGIPDETFPSARLETHYEDGFCTFEYDPSDDRWGVRYLGFTRYGEEPFTTSGVLLLTNGHHDHPTDELEDWKARTLNWVRNGYNRTNLN